MSQHSPAPAAAARFAVGIDLGTTNSALAFLDLEDESACVQSLSIPQLVAPGEVETRETLPSFHYEPATEEMEENARRLPWGDAPAYIVGTLARDRGSDVPGRLSVSAKSWLSHAGVDRTAELLPWHGVPEVQKHSPGEISARYLGHLRAAWNHAHPDAPLEAQEVVITIPASFDDVARELTFAAARRAGLPRVSLLEEPQAAFYAWMAEQGGDDEEGESEPVLEPGERVLVCDIGGGTTDFTLIETQPGGEDGRPVYHRIAVGDHLILGGDNLDLALAHFIEKRFEVKLAPRQWGVLVRRCQLAKETLLGPDAPERLSLSIPAATGTRVIGGAQRIELIRDEVVGLLVDGFLPRVGLEDRPARRASGFQEFGLPFAPDPAITRYLAAFLSAHAGPKGPVPDAVLFNGGFFESHALRERLIEVLADWGGGDQPRVLENSWPDLAVALGAACFGLARRGLGQRIGGGLVRSYYLGIQHGGGNWGLCLAPAGLVQGKEVELPMIFDLLVRQPVEFPLYSSSFRPHDRAGDVVTIDPSQFVALPAIRTAMRGQPEEAGGDSVRVRLNARLTEIGMLEVWCAEADGKRQWKLPFDVRATAHTDIRTSASAAAGERLASLDQETVKRGRKLIADAFGPNATAASVEGVVRELETDLGLGRLEWPPSLLREFWDELLPREAVRVRGPVFEARWLNLIGFCLRPGYGFAVDDWRVAQTWRLFEKKVAQPRNEMCRAEWWILWRRIAGGLTAGQQRVLASPMLAELKKHSGVGWGRQETAEIWRLLGSLEWLEVSVRTELGEWLLGQLASRKFSSGPGFAAVLWALGRMGAREPLYGPLNTLIPNETAENWIGRLIDTKLTGEDVIFALVQMSRLTGDRYRDIDEPVRERVLLWLEAAGAPAHLVELVRQGGEMRGAERDAVFGETLPVGLRLVR